MNGNCLQFPSTSKQSFDTFKVKIAQSNAYNIIIISGRGIQKFFACAATSENGGKKGGHFSQCREKEKRRKKKIHVNIHLGTKFYRFVFFVWFTRDQQQRYLSGLCDEKKILLSMTISKKNVIIIDSIEWILNCLQNCFRIQPLF